MLSPSSMPAQTVPAYPSGANSPMTAGIKMQQQQTEQQMNLIGKSGGKRRKSRSRSRSRRKTHLFGGKAVVQVPPVPAGAVNPSQTTNNYSELTKLSQQQSTQAVYDTAKSPADTSKLQVQQESMYKGGRRTKRMKRRKTHRRSHRRK
jgi:hypothetical protein